MPQDVKHDDLYVVIISTKKERNQLYDLCVKYNIPILYPKLFIEKKVHNLWGISKTGVGLVGTVIARSTDKDKIFHSIISLENSVKNYFKSSLHARKDL